MAKLNIKAYRFSIGLGESYLGDGEVNEQGTRFYDNLVDELIARRD